MIQPRCACSAACTDAGKGRGALEWPQRAGAAGAGPAEARDAATAALAMVSRSWKVTRKATFQLFSPPERKERRRKAA